VLGDGKMYQSCAGKSRSMLHIANVRNPSHNQLHEG
jgi:hypothetical protein